MGGVMDLSFQQIEALKKISGGHGVRIQEAYDGRERILYTFNVSRVNNPDQRFRLLYDGRFVELPQSVTPAESGT
jgi:hypothetical protein